MGKTTEAEHAGQRHDEGRDLVISNPEALKRTNCGTNNQGRQ